MVKKNNAKKKVSYTVFFTQDNKEKKRFETLRAALIRNGKVPYLGCLLQGAAARFPDHNALLYEGAAVTYRTLFHRAVALSRLLQIKGVQPRDRIILLLENSPEFYIGYFAILQVGAVVAPLNIFLKERELAHIIKDASPALIITSQEFMPLLEKAEVALPPLVMATEMPLYNDGELATPFMIQELEPEEMSSLLYTSGTTGFPKGVMLSSKNALMNVIQGIARFDLRPEDRVFGVLPLFHSFAQNSCIWVPMFIGSTVILVRKIDRRAILEGLEQKPTCFLGVPALYGFLALLKTAKFDAVRCFVSGADALPDKIRTAFSLIYRRKICSGYGLTEASPLVAGDLTEETMPPASVGTPLMGIEWVLKDEAGAPVPQGSVGELWIKGDNVMLGYYNAPEMTADVLRDGWLRTGDLFYCDDLGRLIMSGRSKDIIKHKGFIIYPPEVENVILSHPNVLRVAVLGKIDVQTGEVPIAFVQLKENQQGIEQALRALCLKNLASYKVPRDFICSVEQLTITATGKVDKKKLRERL
jgi:long-chain acyl-CoA synthetase